MTTYWTPRRWTGLAIHGLLALIVLAWSASSSFHFWSWAFTNSVYAYGAVACIDALALLGLVMHIARIPSPLSIARHALPLVSALPLGVDMHSQFAHLQDVQAWALTLFVTALLVVLSFVVWRHIEQLFIDPVEAARQYAQQRMQALHTVSAQMGAMQEVADGFVQQHQQRAIGAMQSLQPAVQPMQLAMQPVQTYARPDADVQPVYAAPVDTQPLEPAYQCVKCGATNLAPDGKDPMALRKASGRYGCKQCKTT